MSHLFVLQELLTHIQEIEARLQRFDTHLLQGLATERQALALLQMIPGVDQIGSSFSTKTARPSVPGRTIAPCRRK